MTPSVGVLGSTRPPVSSPMTLRIFNTLSKRAEVFSPLQEGHVRLYVCGMTVYDLCHLGHARSMVAFDVVQRWLKASGYQVEYVRNITDIEDKLIKAAVDSGQPIVDIATKYSKRIIGIKAGEIVFDGPSSELTNDHLTEIYGRNLQRDDFMGVE